MDNTEKFVFGFLGIASVMAVFAMFSAFNIIKPGDGTPTQNVMSQKLTRMSLSPFDSVLARQFMDKDDDGKCDVCGMDIELCMNSGQIQCNMDSKSTIGILGSQHIHADWKIFINGKMLDDSFFEPIARDTQLTTSEITSSFIHAEHGEPGEENVGNVLHMHATGVPLWIFFKSAGMDFNKDCLTLSDGQKFCNDGTSTLKFYVNDKPSNEWENYVFMDMDKILISYGNETELSQQSNSITNFAKDH